jgi:tRNA A37 methylthiotransferase MiaB
VKRRRNNTLLAEQQKVSEELNRALIGQEFEVLVEGQSKLVSRQTAPASSNVELGWERRARFSVHEPAPKTQMIARTRGDHVVCFDGDVSLKGQILDVRIIAARNLTLFGELLNSPSRPARHRSIQGAIA